MIVLWTFFFLMLNVMFYSNYLLYKPLIKHRVSLEVFQVETIWMKCLNPISLDYIMVFLFCLFLAGCFGSWELWDVSWRWQVNWQKNAVLTSGASFSGKSGWHTMLIVEGFSGSSWASSAGQSLNPCPVEWINLEHLLVTVNRRAW